MARYISAESMLNILETMLKAQLQAIEELRRTTPRKRVVPLSPGTPGIKSKSLSQTKMAYEVLLMAGGPLHINDIVARINGHFGASVTRDAVVSAIVKKVAQEKEFVKTDKNTFGIMGRDD